MTSPGTAPAETAAAPTPVYSLAARLGAEAVGTFLLVFAGLGAAMFGTQGGVPVGIAFGLALVAGVIAFGHISGGYFNPAASLGLAIAGRLKWLDMVWYWVAQVISATLAALVLFAVLKVLPAIASGSGQVTTHTLFNSLANGFDTHSPSQVPLIAVLLVEAVGTALFVGVILGATSAQNKTTLAPLAIGLTLAGVITVTAPLSNASINPARSTAVVLFADGWASQQLWLFWVAPLLGGAIAAVFYKAFAAAKPTALPAAVDAGDAGDDEAADVVDAPAPAASALPAPIPAASRPTDAQDFFDKPESGR
ncbi:aquaporin [Specibacter cremeus]|uniref:aquaporin n=1 Tax=Specibacter cremeus TaxID=1629051 RepID=UPI000F7AC65E|nr:aquaporin [Specibacter cremeus]